MKIVTPALKAYRDCGFHNRTLEELRRDANLKRDAVLNEEDENTAHVPNVFGSFVYQDKHYYTSLTLRGLDGPVDEDEVNPSRGFSVSNETEIATNKILWEFKILIPKSFCSNQPTFVPENDPNHTKYCYDLSDRTMIFAMEFLCCYRQFLSMVMELYERGNCDFTSPTEKRDLSDHPKEEEVENLVCTYDAVERHLKWYKTNHAQGEWNFDSIDGFLDNHLSRKRKQMLPYYSRWIKQHRIRPELVEKRTIEFISMAFRDCEHEH